jgi:hypothetical protein
VMAPKCLFIHHQAWWQWHNKQQVEFNCFVFQSFDFFCLNVFFPFFRKNGQTIKIRNFVVLQSFDCYSCIHSCLISCTIDSKVNLQVAVHGIVGYKVWVAVPSFVAAAVVEIVLVLASATMVLSLVEPVVGRFHLLADHMDHKDLGLDIYVVFLVAGERLVGLKVVTAVTSWELVLGLVEHLAAVVEHQPGRFAHLVEALVLEVAVHIFEEALSASFHDNDDHMDQFVAVDLDRVDALDVACHEEDRGARPDEGDIFVDEDAWVNGVLVCVVVEVEDRALDDHASADARTLDVADGEEDVAIVHLCHQDQSDAAYDAGQAVHFAGVDPS